MLTYKYTTKNESLDKNYTEEARSAQIFFKIHISPVRVRHVLVLYIKTLKYNKRQYQKII